MIETKGKPQFPFGRPEEKKSLVMGLILKVFEKFILEKI